MPWALRCWEVSSADCDALGTVFGFADPISRNWLLAAPFNIGLLRLELLEGSIIGRTGACRALWLVLCSLVLSTPLRRMGLGAPTGASGAPPTARSRSSRSWLRLNSSSIFSCSSLFLRSSSTTYRFFFSRETLDARRFCARRRAMRSLSLLAASAEHSPEEEVLRLRSLELLPLAGAALRLREALALASEHRAAAAAAAASIDGGRAEKAGPPAEIGATSAGTPEGDVDIDVAEAPEDGRKSSAGASRFRKWSKAPCADRNDDPTMAREEAGGWGRLCRRGSG